MRRWTPPEYDVELWDVIEAYGFKPSKVEFVSGVYRIQDQGETYALKKSNRSKEKLMLFYQMSEELRNNGYPHLLSWQQTLSGEPVVKTDHAVWYATKWVGDQESSTNYESAIPLVKSIAIFHRLAEPITARFPMLQQQEKEDRLDRWRERKEKWEGYVQQASSQEYPSSVDRLIHENCEMVDKLFTFALKGMERFLKIENENPTRTTLCHQRIHPSNCVQDDEQFYWIDWDHVRVDTPVKDLALFIHRFTEQEGPEEILYAYEEENPLSVKEKRLLAIYLAYPERFLSKVSKYYEEPRIATEGESWQEIQQEFLNYQSFYPLISELWNSHKKEPVSESREKKAKKSATKGRTSATTRVASKKGKRRKR